jgi:hypothetical protein
MFSRMIMRRLFCYIIIIFGVSLIGCQPPAPTEVASPSYPSVMTKKHRPILSELRKLGAHYQFFGKHLVVLIPVSNFFQKDTIHLKEGYNKKIVRLAKLVQRYSEKHPVRNIRLVGYPDTRPVNNSLVLPHQYAVIIAGYLWNEGLPMRISNSLATSKDRHWVKKILPRVKSAHGVVLELS